MTAAQDRETALTVGGRDAATNRQGRNPNAPTSPVAALSVESPNLMEREGAWSEDGQAWFAKAHYPKRSQAMSYFASFCGIPYIEVRCYSRHACYAPDHPNAAMYDGAYWVECPKDHPGAFPVWRCE